MTDFLSIFESLNKGGLVFGLVIVLIGGYRGWWVYGWHYKAKNAECEQWKALVMSGHSINRDAVKTLASLVQQP